MTLQLGRQFLALLAKTREGHGEMTPWEEVALKQREGGRRERKKKKDKQEGGEWKRERGPDLGSGHRCAVAYELGMLSQEKLNRF